MFNELIQTEIVREHERRMRSEAEHERALPHHSLLNLLRKLLHR